MSAARKATLNQAQLDQLAINTIRFLSVDAVQQANSGHPGLPLGAASMAYVLWARFLRHNPINPQWSNRDRFVLSAGHGSILLYSLLHLTGYDLPLGQIKKFRQWGSITPGHPERGVTPGVETTTGQNLGGLPSPSSISHPKRSPISARPCRVVSMRSRSGGIDSLATPRNIPTWPGSFKKGCSANCPPVGMRTFPFFRRTRRE